MNSILLILQRMLGNCNQPSIPKMTANAGPGFADPVAIVLGTESQEKWHAHLKNYSDAFVPANYPEIECVQMLASITWRLSRLTAWETDLINQGQPVPASLYQALAALQSGYQTALDAMSKLPALTKASANGPGKVVILCKQPPPQRPAAPAPNPQIQPR